MGYNMSAYREGWNNYGQSFYTKEWKGKSY